jgi:hypothetical protein
MQDHAIPLSSLSASHRMSVRTMFPMFGDAVPLSLVKALAEVDDTVIYFKGLKVGDTFRFIGTDGGIHLARLVRIDSAGFRYARNVYGDKGKDMWGEEFELLTSHIPDRRRRQTLDPDFVPVVVETRATGNPDFVVKWHVHVDNDGWEHSESSADLGVTIRKREYGSRERGTYGYVFEAVIDSGRNVRPKSFKRREEARQWATDTLHTTGERMPVAVN